MNNRCMIGRRKRVRRLLLCVISYLLAVLWLLPTGLAADTDEGPEHEVRKYEIAVVFDNSGSMYEDGDGKMWCQAKYAMEIFASMLDYDGGDRLHIFPMWKVTTDGGTPSDGGGKADAGDRIDISGKDDFEKIHQLFTISASGTPFEPVEYATEYLSKISDDKTDRWLIVLTDGKFDGQYNSDDNLTTALTQRSSANLNVQYLGVGSGASDLTGSGDHFFADKAPTGSALQDALISICNRIFQRNVLPANRLQGTSLKLDLSMRKVIVFAQGSNAKISGLTSSDGKSVSATMDSGERTYSPTKWSSGNRPGEADTSLAGQVVTFDAAAAGDYTLQTSGADKIEIFYEPDVRIKTVLKNNDGIEMQEGDAIYPGTYKLENTIVDRVTGEDVSTSELLGKNVKYDVRVAGKSVENNAPVELQEGDDVKIEVTATYLDKYTIRNYDSPFAKGFEVVLPDAAKLEVKIESSQKVPWYRTTRTDDWEPIKVRYLLNGQPLTPEEMQEMEYSFGFEKDEVVFSQKYLPDECAFRIDFGRAEDGSFVKPEDGTYRFKATGSAKDSFGRTLTGDDSLLVTFRWYSKWIIFGIVMLILLIIAAIIYFIMSRKVLPRKVQIDRLEYKLNGKTIATGNRMKYDRKGKRIMLQSAPAPNPNAICNVTFRLYPVGKRYTPSKRRRFGIGEITGASPGVTSVHINGTVYKRDKNGKFVSAIDPLSPIQEEGSSPMLVVNAAKASLTCMTKQK